MTPKALHDLTRDELIQEVMDLRQQLAALSEASDEKYRVILDESSDPIFSFAPDGRYHYVNQAFAQGVGRPRESIVGHRIWDVFPQDEADRRYALVRWVFENGQCRDIEVRVPRSDGDRYYITTVKPVFGAQGRVEYVICNSKDITDRKRMEEHLIHLAQRDPLTGLPNRALFTDRLQQAIAKAVRSNTCLALIFVDLDHFKRVNDSHGHRVGDLLLQDAARRMQSCMRASDTVGRIGGDEFVVLLAPVDQPQDAQTVADKVCLTLAQPFDLPELPGLEVSCSAGIALYPAHGRDEIELSRHADDAMYRAKAGGRNQARMHEPRP